MMAVYCLFIRWSKSSLTNQLLLIFQLWDYLNLLKSHFFPKSAGFPMVLPCFSQQIWPFAFSRSSGRDLGGTRPGGVGREVRGHLAGGDRGRNPMCWSRKIVGFYQQLGKNGKLTNKKSTWCILSEMWLKAAKIGMEWWNQGNLEV